MLTLSGTAHSQITDGEKARLFACDIFFRRADAVQHRALVAGAGASERAALKQSYDLNDTTLDQLMVASARYTRAVAELDNEARAIIQTAKQAGQRKPGARGASVPAPPARLMELQQQKYQLLRDTISDFTSSAGPAQAQYFLYTVTSGISVRKAATGQGK